MADEKEPTTNAIAAGLGRLVREVRLLKQEVAALVGRLRGRDEPFERYYPIPAKPIVVGFDYAGGRESSETNEPRSAIRDLAWELRDEKDVAITNRALMAIMRDLDGALRDIRAARADIDAIADDSDARGAFKDWGRRP